MSPKQDIVFRGTREGLYLVLNDDQDFGVLKEKLKEHLKKAEYFFQSADVILDSGKMTLSLDQILEIQNLLAYPYGLRLKRIVHGGTQGHDISQERRRIRENAKSLSQTESGKLGAPSEPEKAKLLSQSRDLRQIMPFQAGSNTLLHKGTLRSGQRISYDGNVVVVGDVNPGAEVQASGDIVVVGALRGLAHAGANGDSSVVVVAVRLEPTQLRIGDVIGRPPEGDASSGKEPEVAKLKDGMILVEPLDSIRWEGEH